MLEDRRHFAFRAFKWGIQFSFWSKITPRNLVDDLILISKFCRIRGGRVGIGLRFLNMKRTVLREENLNALSEAQTEIASRFSWSSLWVLIGQEALRDILKSSANSHSVRGLLT